jgi:hypothetical protein
MSDLAAGVFNTIEIGKEATQTRSPNLRVMLNPTRIPDTSFPFVLAANSG